MLGEAEESLAKGDVQRRVQVAPLALELLVLLHLSVSVPTGRAWVWAWAWEQASKGWNAQAAEDTADTLRAEMHGPTTDVHVSRVLDSHPPNPCNPRNMYNGGRTMHLCP